MLLPPRIKGVNKRRQKVTKIDKVNTPMPIFLNQITNMPPSLVKVHVTFAVVKRSILIWEMFKQNKDKKVNRDQLKPISWILNGPVRYTKG